MGCNFSATGGNKQKVNVARGGEGNIQDAARSYRSKVGAIRIILKNVHTRRALIKYLETYKKAEYVKCFRELEEIRVVKEDKLFKQQLKNLVSSYKSIMEVAEHKQMDQDAIEFALWDCFGPLRHTELESATPMQLNKYLHVAQDSLLSQVCQLFEKFLESKEYEDCKGYAVDNQNMQRNVKTPKGQKLKTTGPAKENSVHNSISLHNSLRGTVRNQQGETFQGVLPS